MTGGRLRALAGRASSLLSTAAGVAAGVKGLPAGERIRILRAAQRARSSDPIEARVAFNSVRAGHTEPANVAMARIHVRAALHAWNFPEALERADALLEAIPGEPDSLLLRAQAQRELGHLTDALATVERARGATDPRSRDALRRDIDGTITTQTGEWLPTIPGTTSTIDPVRERILHLADRSLPHWRTGYSIRTASIVGAQRRAGLAPTVATRLGIPAIGGTYRFPLIETIDGVDYHRLLDPAVGDYKALPRDEYLTRYAARAAALVEELRPSVIHAHAAHANGLVALALRERYGIPVVYEVRNFYEDFWPTVRDAPQGTEAQEGLLRVETQCMRAADRVVILSEDMRARIVERGVDPERVVVIGNGVDPDRFTPRARDPELAASIGLSDAPVVGYISSLRKHEDIDTLVRAIGILRREGRDVQGLLVGDGPLAGQVRALMAELGLGAAVHMTGWVESERVLDHYALIDIFVVPRPVDPVVNEVTPLKPFEALAMGIPLVVSDLPGLRAVIGDDERGRAYTPEDPKALASTLASLLDDEDLRTRLATDGRTWVEGTHTWAKNAEVMKAMYDSLR